MDRHALDRILSDGYLGDLPSRPTEDIRRLRAECKGVEDSVSYLRRLVQGRLDIVTAERRRRAEGLPPASLDDLVAGLPDTLGDRIAGAAPSGRLTATLGPGTPDPTLTDELDACCPASLLGRLPELDDADLVALADDLAALDRKVSDQRRALFARLDALSGELARRYRDGEASVEALLQ